MKALKQLGDLTHVPSTVLTFFFAYLRDHTTVLQQLKPPETQDDALGRLADSVAI